MFSRSLASWLAVCLASSNEAVLSTIPVGAEPHGKDGSRFGEIEALSRGNGAI